MFRFLLIALLLALSPLRAQYYGGGSNAIGASVQTFGAKGDGVSDDRAAIQRAIDACPSRGCEILFPPGTYLIFSSIVPKSNVVFRGVGWTMEASVQVPQSLIKGNGAFPLFKTTSNTEAISWIGLAFQGTSATGSRGIDLANYSHDPLIRDCFFDTFGDEAITLRGGLSARLEHVFIQNALLVRTGRTGYVGAVDVTNTDARLDHVDATASVILNPAVGSHLGSPKVLLS